MCNVRVLSDSNEYLLPTHRSNVGLLGEFRWDFEGLDEVNERLSSLGRLVFLDHVSTVVDDYHLVLAHHVSPSQLGIHAVCCRQKKLFLNFDV